MSIDLGKHLWQLPGARRFFARMIDAIKAGKSLWVIFPPFMSVLPFEEALFDALRNDYFHPLDLQKYGQCTIVKALADAFPCLPEDEKWTVEKLIHEQGGPDYILLQNFEKLDAHSRRQWAQAVNTWAETARRYALKRSLCIYTTADAIIGIEDLLREDVRLQIEYWYAILSTSELGLLCRMVDDRASLPALWRQYLLPSLCGGDVTLMEYLWDVIFDPVDKITGALSAFASQRAWDMDTVRLSGNGWKPAPPLIEPTLRHQSLHLWQQGWLTYTPENGEEIHTALLPLLDKESEVRHRLWRGQTALLLPLIDSIRVLICGYLIAHYGEDWPRLAGRTDAEAYAELGALEVILRNTPQLEWEKQQWLETVMQARLLRNDLAHYTPVHFDDFARFWRHGQRVYQQLRH